VLKEFRTEENRRVYATSVLYALEELLVPTRGAAGTQVVRSDRYHRTQYECLGDATLLADEVPDIAGATCFFLRLAPGRDRVARFAVEGSYELEACPAGGWLLTGKGSEPCSYWIVQPPTARKIDFHGRILSEQAASIVRFRASSDELSVDIAVPGDAHLDLTLWRFASEASDIEESLKKLLVLERQPFFLGSSHSVYHGPSDVYRCLVHGNIYDNRFVWRKGAGFRWRICSENEALSLYLILHGLELATQRRLYTLLKRQIVFSVIARQAPDGGWYHGEWTDLMESHYRLHNGGMRVLEAALEESVDDVVRSALQRASEFLQRGSDKTDLGLWFLHDTLEQSVETMRTPGAPPWRANRILGSSESNKLILNTHLDAIVVLDRYGEVTGDKHCKEQVLSAEATVRALLALRPAEPIYRVCFWAVALTLLPSTKIERLPITLRILRRLASRYVVPKLYLLKQLFPRIVMPGGLIERHLSPPHWSASYHPVNVVDLARMCRRMPDEDLDEVLQQAVAAVTETSLLEYWAESKQRQAVGYWVEALYYMCTLNRAEKYRHSLAEAILYADDVGLGLPASLLGGNPEAAKLSHQIPCPSPTEPRLRVANLSCNGTQEVLVVNCSSATLPCHWEEERSLHLTWTRADGHPAGAKSRPLEIPPRGWVWGKQVTEAPSAT
jgi:hypothetical protein